MRQPGKVNATYSEVCPGAILLFLCCGQWSLGEGYILTYQSLIHMTKALFASGVGRSPKTWAMKTGW